MGFLSCLRMVRITELKDNGVTSAQLNIWMITASIGPIVFNSKGNWLDVLVYGGIISLLVCITMRFGRHWSGPVYSLLQSVWIILMLSQFLQYSAGCWPTGERTFPVVPLVLLGLAAATSLKGAKCTAGGICVLFWFVAFLFGTVLAAGVPDLNVEYTVPSNYGINAPMMLTFLIPAVAGFLPRRKTGKLSFVIVVVVAVAVTVWVSGVLSPRIAAEVQWPFYEAAKSVQLFNVAKRLESLVSVGVTVANYALYSLLLCCVRNIGEKFGLGREAVVVGGTLSASLMLLGVSIDAAILFIVCAIFWIFLPLLGVLKKKLDE